MKSKSVSLINSINRQKSNQKFLVSVSGGQDSISLFILFFCIENQHSLNLNLFWNNHLWHKNSFFITRHLFKLSFLFRKRIHNVIAVTSVKSELQARRWRLKSSRRLKSFYNYSVLIKGHTATDKIETLLLNLFRGTANTSPFSLTDSFFSFSQRQKRKVFFFYTCCPSPLLRSTGYATPKACWNYFVQVAAPVLQSTGCFSPSSQSTIEGKATTKRHSTTEIVLLTSCLFYPYLSSMLVKSLIKRSTKAEENKHCVVSCLNDSVQVATLLLSLLARRNRQDSTFTCVAKHDTFVAKHDRRESNTNNKKKYKRKIKPVVYSKSF